MTEIETIVRAAESRAWYPLFGGVLTLALALFKKVAPDTWDSLPTRWQWTPVVGASFAGGFVEAFSRGLSWHVAIVMAFYAAVTTGVASVGIHHVGKRVGAAKEVAVASLVLLLQACGGGSPPPCTPLNLARVTAECDEQERKAGCADDPEKKCPEIVAECDRRVDAMSDEEACR